jgi:DNA-binding transcriptional regulator YiaG
MKGKKTVGRAEKSEKRNLFSELMSGVEAMRQHREGEITLRTHEVTPLVVPPVNPQFVRETREGLHMSRQVFAFKLGVSPRTLEGQPNLLARQTSYLILFLTEFFRIGICRARSFWHAVRSF